MCKSAIVCGCPLLLGCKISRKKGRGVRSWQAPDMPKNNPHLVGKTSEASAKNLPRLIRSNCPTEDRTVFSKWPRSRNIKNAAFMIKLRSWLFLDNGPFENTAEGHPLTKVAVSYIRHIAHDLPSVLVNSAELTSICLKSRWDMLDAA